MRFQILFLLLLLFLSISTVSAQIDDPITVDSSIIRLNVGVADAKGSPITNLTRQNFTIYEDGVRQDITRFEPSAAPFSVVMMLDMSGSTKSFRQNIQLAASRFIDALAPDDRVAVIEFYDKINLRNNFTTDRKTIRHSISVANGQGDTNFYKALSFALEKLVKEGKRRKAIVVLTDGIDTQAQNQDRIKLNSLSNESEVPSAIKPEQYDNLNQVLNQADRLGVTIYPLALPTGDPKRLADPSPKQFAMYDAARSRMKILADRTGGTLNAINKLEDMGRLYAVVAAELRTLYTVEYQSTNDKRDGKWRVIKIEINNPDLIPKTRQGYFAK
jgi:Ca-activated chloride channel family protein